MRFTWGEGRSQESPADSPHTRDQTHFAHNFQRSFFKHARKRCNSNDLHSTLEAPSKELRAKFLETTRPCVAPNKRSSSYALHHTQG